MALPTSGPLSIADICGVNGLNIGFNPPARELHELANMAATTSTPYINRANPSIFHWYGYGVVVSSTILASTVAIFNISRTTYSDAKTSTSSDTVTTSGSNYIGNAQIDSGTSYEMGRLLAIFDTSSITSTPTDGTFTCYITSNSVPNSLTFRTIAPNVSFTAPQTLLVTDWDNFNNASGMPTDEGNISVPTSTTGFFSFTLSSSQLSSIGANNTFAVYIISNGDYSDTPPISNSRPMFSAQSGTGISGIGDYKLVLNGSAPPSELEINSSVPTSTGGLVGFFNGEPNETLGLSFTLTFSDESFTSLEFGGGISMPAIDSGHPTRTGSVTLDSSGNLTANYTYGAPNAPFNGTLTITSRSSGLPLPASPSVGISNT